MNFFQFSFEITIISLYSKEISETENIEGILIILELKCKEFASEHT